MYWVNANFSAIQIPPRVKITAVMFTNIWVCIETPDIVATVIFYIVKNQQTFVCW